MAEKIAKKGDLVLVDYTGKLETGETFDTSKNGKPLEFEIGAGKIIKGFDSAVVGMKVGEEKKITINPEDAYGKRSENYVKEIPKQAVPKDIELKKGHILMFKRDDGLNMPAVINEVKEKTLMIDFNHPLAGKKLNFEIKLVGFR